MGLKEALNRIKRIEKTSGFTEREKIIKQVNEHIESMERNQPWHIQEMLWSLVELSYEEIRQLGRNQKSLDDYKDRFKIDYAAWMQGKCTGSTAYCDNDGREIAIFNAARGDEYYDYHLTDVDRRARGLYRDKATL